MHATLAQIQAISDQINKIEKMRYTKIKNTAKANKCILAETINKYWCGWGKDKKPRDTIDELRRNHNSPAPPTFTTNSKEMANIAVDHYDGIQNQDLDIPPSLR